MVVTLHDLVLKGEDLIYRVEIIDGDTSCRQFLRPGQAPEATFQTQKEGIVAREYCNVHGLWKS